MEEGYYNIAGNSLSLTMSGMPAKQTRWHTRPESFGLNDDGGVYPARITWLPSRTEIVHRH